MELLSGKVFRDNVSLELKEKINELGYKPSLVVIRIGEDEASSVYIRQKERLAAELGVLFFCVMFDENSEEAVIFEKIEELNNDASVNAIMIQLPISDKFDESRLRNAILPIKDVDCLTNYNIGGLSDGSSYVKPCTASGIVELMDYYNIIIGGKDVVIVGRSNLVGKPLATLLVNRDATVTVCHSKTKELSSFTRKADILIVAVGKKGFITSDMVKTDAVIIDVGINKENNKIYGDVDFDGVSSKCSCITPVPGGVGVVTTMMLFINVYDLCMKQNSGSN